MKNNTTAAPSNTRDPQSWGARMQIGRLIHVDMQQKHGVNPRVVAHIGEAEPSAYDAKYVARRTAKANPIVGTYIRDTGDYFAIRIPRVGVVVVKRDQPERDGWTDRGFIVLVV